MKIENRARNSEDVYRILGANNHSKKKRAELDYYATDPQAVELLLELEDFSNKIWEPAAGGLHITSVLNKHGYDVFSTDIIDRGGMDQVIDFLNPNEAPGEFDGDIITNPPYSKGGEFVRRAIDIVKPGHKVAMFLKIQFLEGKSRRALFEEFPPIRIWVSSSRLKCAPNGEFDDTSSAVCYCWFIWEKGFNGHPQIRWFN